MKLSIQECSRGVVVKMEGDLTLDSNGAVKSAITEVVADHPKAIVLDMSEVGFIDSQGLEFLLWARDYCLLSLLPFRLAGLDANCRTILRITRLEGEFSLTDDLAEAVRSLA